MIEVAKPPLEIINAESKVIDANSYNNYSWFFYLINSQILGTLHRAAIRFIEDLVKDAFKLVFNMFEKNNIFSCYIDYP